MTIQDAENVAQNTQNGPEAGLAVGSVYFVHDSGRVKTLLAELRAAGVVLSIKGDQLAFDAPARAMTDDLLARMRADRDGLLAALSGVAVDPVADPVAESVAAGGDHDGIADSRPVVVNVKRGDVCDVYIGRPRRGFPANPWGNKFLIPRDGDRAEVIRKYRDWIVTQPDLMARLPELRGKRLGCWCAPLDCHGDVLADLVDRFNERAAIREYDGGLSRADAERLAVADLMAPVICADDPGPIDDSPGDDPAESVGVADPVVAKSIRCPSCGEIDLADDTDGLRCGSCGVLAWVATDEGGLVRCDVPEIELIDPDRVPVCLSCGRWCDVLTAAGSWHCSRCDPMADDRRRRSMRVIGLVSRSRGRGQSVADSRATGGTVYRDALPPSVVFFDDPVPGDRCGRCRSVYSHLIPIHKGDSLRRDCSGCGRYIENPVWYDPAAARDLLAGLKT